MKTRILKLALLWFIVTFVLVGIATFISLHPIDRYALYINRGDTTMERSARIWERAAQIGMKPEELARLLLARQYRMHESRLIGTKETADFIRDAKRAGIDIQAESFKGEALNRFLTEHGDREILGKIEEIKAKMALLRKK